MIKLEFENIEKLKQVHYDAVKSYVCEIMTPKLRYSLYKAIRTLPDFAGIAFEDITWLKKFILADVFTLRTWATNYSTCLQFNYMQQLYLNRFSNGTSHFVDKAKSYNAYTLFDLMDYHVCPYCEHEYIEVVEIYGKKRRTIEFDHFYPKGKDEYPGLAMCFFNLIPCCKQCNNLKLVNSISASPYEDDIETLTHLHPDLPVGILIENVSVDECKIKLHAKGRMVRNDEALALQQRYSTISHEVHQLLYNHQNYPEDKLDELVRLGVGTKENLKYSLFGNSRAIAKGKELHTKMKEDLIGY